jgi:catechol 2,3-dioxygenase-like lactoylglutathione lyase family enzyme
MFRAELRPRWEYVHPLQASHLRIVRPSRDLERAETFWVSGLGLEVLFRAGPGAEGGHALLMVGWPAAAWHLELAGDLQGETPPAPTEEDLLVLHTGGLFDDSLIRRLGPVGVTIADPDGYRLPLSHRTWGGRQPGC